MSWVCPPKRAPACEVAQDSPFNLAVFPVAQDSPFNLAVLVAREAWTNRNFKRRKLRYPGPGFPVAQDSPFNLAVLVVREAWTNRNFKRRKLRYPEVALPGSCATPDRFPRCGTFAGATKPR